jgi:hypothetical protein
MKRTIVLMMVIGVMVIQSGCGPKKAAHTGFLSDYSKLKARSDVSARYRDLGRLGNYSKFIIDPVVVHFHTGSKARGKIKEQDLTDLKNYMHTAIVEAIEDKYEIVYRPGPGVARGRIAVTDLKKSKIVQNIIPIGKVAGTGLGGASMEAELIDSQTGQQIAALVESQIGERLSLDGYSTWGDAKGIMDRWARTFRASLDEAHK